MEKKEDKRGVVSLAEKLLLELCSDASLKRTKKQLRKAARSKCPGHVKDKHVKKAWKKLEREGLIVLSDDGSYYHVPKKESERGSGDSSTDEERQMPDDDEVVPFAEILRRRAAQATTTPVKKAYKEEKVDIDEEIRRLEAELATDGNSDDESSKNTDDGDSGKKVSFGQTTVREIPSDPPKSGKEAIVCLSTLADERIAPLPTGCLPQNKKRALRGIDDVVANPTSKKKRNVQVNNGLKQAVKEVLDGYVARSSERLPFYCRVCALQLQNETDFFQHKQSEFHKVAAEMERKASHCRLCRKQFTSPVQLKEHVTSRPHRERLQMITSRQNKRPGRGQHRGPGRPYGQSNRQWC